MNYVKFHHNLNIFFGSCRYSYQVSNEWGYLTAAGTWTGGIASLIDNTSDIFAAELMMTSDRVSAITFTTPLYSTKYCHYVQNFVKF